MKAKKGIHIFLLLLISASLVACKKDKVVFEKGFLESREHDYKKEEMQEAKLYRDIREGKILEIKNMDSWYLNNILSDRGKISFGEVKNAILEHQKEVVFSKAISEAEFDKVMNLIYLDTPESFPIKYAYKYQLDENKNVKKLLLDYILSKEEADKVYEDLKEKEIQAIKENRGRKDVEAIRELVEKNSSNLSLVDKDEKSKRSMNYFTTILSNEAGSGKFPLASSLDLVSKLRPLGVECFVKCGQITSNELNSKSKEYKKRQTDEKVNVNEKIEAPTFKNSDISKFKEVKTEKDIKVVRMHPEYLYTWVVAKIDNKWLNIDPYFDMLSSVYKETNINSSIFAPDYILAHSRNFSFNENIFGVTPASNDINYLLSVKDKAFILHKTKEEALDMLEKEIEENAKNEKTEFYYQFEDKETMDLYLRNLPKAIEEINKKNENIISSYKVCTDYSRLLVEVKDVKYTV